MTIGMNKKLSVIIVLRNEQDYIEKLLNMLLKQTIDQKDYEIILVDGHSTDHTLDIISTYVKAYPNFITLINNPKQTLPPGWNLGIKASKGEYIIRLDGHTLIDKDFLEKYLEVIGENPEVDCVGGIIKSKGKGYQGTINEYVYSHPFGVGNSKFRTTKGVWEGFVDTVPYGAYKRAVFKKVGFFNENLKRNEDIEFHKRMKDLGGKFYLSTTIYSTYYVRNTLKGLIEKSLGDGMWTMIADRAVPGSLRLRHKIPLFAFLVGLIVCLSALFSPLMVWLLLFLISCYFLGSFIASLDLAKRKGLKYFVPTIGTFFCLHFFRGLGSFLAFFKKEYWDYVFGKHKNI